MPDEPRNNDRSRAPQDAARDSQDRKPPAGSPGRSRRRGRAQKSGGHSPARRPRPTRVRRDPRIGKGLELSAVAVPFLTLIAAFAFCYFARPILVPLVLAMTLAYILSPSVTLLTRYKLPRVLAVLIVLFVAFGVLGALGFLVVDQAQGLARALPGYWATVQSWVGGLEDWMASLPPPFRDLLPPPETDLWSQLELVDFSALSSTLFTGLGSVLSYLGWGILVSFLTLFMLLDMPNMYQRMVRAMGQDNEEVVKSTLAHINAQLHTFLAVKLGTSAALGIVATIGLLLLNVPYAYVWGPLIGFLNIIPYIGSIISAVPPIIVAIIASHDVMRGVYVLILVIALQQIEGNIVTPKLMGDRIKLNVVAVLLSTIIWGYLWGAIGVLLAIPMTATMKVVCDRIEPLRPIAALLG